MVVFGPAMAGIIVAGWTEKRDGLERLIKPLFHWRVGLQWYLAALFLPALTMLTVVFMFRLIRGEWGLTDFPGWSAIFPWGILWIMGILLFQLLFIWGEELGWRGYALPRMQARYGPLAASLILGILWGFWHLPAFYDVRSQQYGIPIWFFILAIIAYTIQYTWIYNGSGGSVLLMCLFHAAFNATVSYTMMFFKPLIQEPILSLCILGIEDLIIISLAGTSLLYGTRSITPGTSLSRGWLSNDGTKLAGEDREKNLE